MKKLVLLFVVAYAINSDLNAQTITNHPTIDSVDVKYTSSGTMNIGNISGIPLVTFTLKDLSNISKVYLKIKDKSNNNIIYQVNYNINNPIVVNNQQKLMFERSNNKVFISSGSILPLKPYEYELKTENAQNVQTQVFLITK